MAISYIRTGVLHIMCLYFCVTIMVSKGAKRKTREPPPTYGWCKGPHGPRSRVPAQSGYQGYCKSCYRERFPEEFAEKLRKRKKMCGYCGTQKELIGGFCKPCRRSRECVCCSAVNTNQRAPFCKHCGGLRKKLGADGERLALWCSTCTTEEELEML